MVGTLSPLITMYTPAPVPPYRMCTHNVATGPYSKGLVKHAVSADDALPLNWGGSVRRPDFLRETMRKPRSKYLDAPQRCPPYDSAPCIAVRGTLPHLMAYRESRSSGSSSFSSSFRSALYEFGPESSSSSL